MNFEAQQFFIKHNVYYFMKIINYRENTNFTKQYKSTSNMGQHLLRGTTAFSNYVWGEKIRKARNRKFYSLGLQNEDFLNI